MGAFKSLRRGSANMDVLVSIGTSASYFFSMISILHHHMMVRSCLEANDPIVENPVIMMSYRRVPN